MPLARLSRFLLRSTKSANPKSNLELLDSRNINKINHFLCLLSGTYLNSHTICYGGSCFDCLFHLFDCMILFVCREIQVG